MSATDLFVDKSTSASSDFSVSFREARRGSVWPFPPHFIAAAQLADRFRAAFAHPQCKGHSRPVMRAPPEGTLPRYPPHGFAAPARVPRNSQSPPALCRTGLEPPGPPSYPIGCLLGLLTCWIGGRLRLPWGQRKVATAPRIKGVTGAIGSWMMPVNLPPPRP
jgi:hypothetical protein